jgi:hypothetical protein
MMLGALSLALALRAASPLGLALDERCQIIEAVLAAPAKRGLSGTPKLGTVDVTFPEIEHVRRRTRRGSDRTIVHVLWRGGSGDRPVFADTESCASARFVLEPEEEREYKATLDPDGNSDHVVKIALLPSRIKGKSPQFRFEERLELSVHAYPPRRSSGGGYAVPPTRYTGTVEKTSDGKWVAKVDKAIFGS